MFFLGELVGNFMFIPNPLALSVAERTIMFKSGPHGSSPISNPTDTFLVSVSWAGTFFLLVGGEGIDRVVLEVGGIK